MGNDDSDFGDIRVLQVSNISPNATKDQIHQLFSYIGRAEEYQVFPSNPNAQASQKLAYIKYDKKSAIEHLTNTVFVDRAIISVPAQSNQIPDEDTALQLGATGAGARQLPPHVVNTFQDLGDGQRMLLTSDPTLVSLGLPPYPPLPAETETSKVEEIRRTVYIDNLPKDVDGDELIYFFNTNIGEVMYLRLTACDNLPCAYAYIEFTTQSTVPLALQANEIEFKKQKLRITHSLVAIIKPQRKTPDQALEEVEEAIKRDQATGVESKKAGNVSRGYSPYSGSPNRTPSPRRSSTKSRSKNPPCRRDHLKTTRSPPAKRRRSSTRPHSKNSSRRKEMERSRTRSRSPSAKRQRRSRARNSRHRSKSQNRRSRKRDRDRDYRKRRSRSRRRSKSHIRSEEKSRNEDELPIYNKCREYMLYTMISEISPGVFGEGSVKKCVTVVDSCHAVMAAHCLPANFPTNSTFKVYSRKGENFEVRLVTVRRCEDCYDDFVIVEILDGEFPHFPPDASLPEAGVPYFILGYDSEYPLATQLSVFKGSFRNTKIYPNQSYVIGSPGTTAGCSGGGAFSMEGTLYGICVAGRLDISSTLANLDFHLQSLRTKLAEPSYSHIIPINYMYAYIPDQSRKLKVKTPVSN